jgi:hypothetical protein
MCSTDETSAPLPGIAIEYREAFLIVQRFRTAFRLHTTGRPEHIPTWCTFPVGTQLIWDDFYVVMEKLLSKKGVYFYQEGSPTTKIVLQLATVSEIIAFFKMRQPWQDKDYYVFDDTLTFCAAITHDDDIIYIEK